MKEVISQEWDTYQPLWERKPGYLG